MECFSRGNCESKWRKDMKIELNKSEIEYIVSGLEELCESDLEENEYEEIGKIIEKLEA